MRKTDYLNGIQEYAARARVDEALRNWRNWPRCATCHCLVDSLEQVDEGTKTVTILAKCSHITPQSDRELMIQANPEAYKKRQHEDAIKVTFEHQWGQDDLRQALRCMVFFPPEHRENDAAKG